MLLFKRILIIIFCSLKHIWANLKSCSDTQDSKPEICLTSNGKYDPPFPVNVSVGIFLREIIDIDTEKNSITARLGLTTRWTDPKLTLKNYSQR